MKKFQTFITETKISLHEKERIEPTFGPSKSAPSRTRMDVPQTYYVSGRKRIDPIAPSFGPKKTETPPSSSALSIKSWHGMPSRTDTPVTAGTSTKFLDMSKPTKPKPDKPVGKGSRLKIKPARAPAKPPKAKPFLDMPKPTNAKPAKPVKPEKGILGDIGRALDILDPREKPKRKPKTSRATSAAPTIPDDERSKDTDALIRRKLRSSEIIRNVLRNRK